MRTYLRHFIEFWIIFFSIIGVICSFMMWKGSLVFVRDDPRPFAQYYTLPFH